MSYKFESKQDELYFKNYNSLREAIEYASGNGDKILKTVEAFLATLASNNISVSANYLGSNYISSENKEIQNETVRKYIENGCKGDLDLSDIHITSLPEGLTVGGSLCLRGTNITSLPEGLTVGGYLSLSNTSITNLPEGLSVGGGLYLSYTKITSLPEGLSVGDYLYLHDTPISKKYTKEQLKSMLLNVKGEIHY